MKQAMIGGLGVLAGAAGAVLATGAVPGKSETVNTTDRAAIEKIVREYILANPEILPEAMQNLERKEASTRVKEQGDKVSTPFAAAWEGAADADVTIVEFFDYACGYCKLAVPDIDKLLASDKKVRIVYRELPILGPGSDEAARVSLAVAKLGGNYGAYHRALFGAGRPSTDTINAALKTAGVDVKQARAIAASEEISAEIKSNLALQQGLGLSGTPSWVIGDQLIGGAVGYDDLKAAVEEARKAG
jgi:protein-disulfide isomerase